LRSPSCRIADAALLYFDIETTGLHPGKGAEVTEVAVLDSGGLRLGWTRDSSEGNFGKLIPALFDHLEDGVVVGHNLSFDFRFVAYEAGRRALEGPDVRYIDTYALAKELDPDASSFKLENLAGRYDLPVQGEFHAAETDAAVSCELLWHFVLNGDVETLGQAGLSRIQWDIA
jgi:DNA polymerase III epsilon subunit-like protein